MDSLTPFKGHKGLKVTKIKDSDLGNYLSVKEQTTNIHTFVGTEEINNMKRVNYGDSGLAPSYFNKKIKKME